MSGGPEATRRAVLLGGLAVAISACRPKRTSRANRPTSVDGGPDRPALATALAAERELLARYDAFLADSGSDAVPQAAMRGVHRQHVDALERALGTAGPSEPERFAGL